MNEHVIQGPLNQEQVFYVSEVSGAKVMADGKKLGTLVDVIVKELDQMPEVIALYVARSFGDPSLLIPWENVESFSTNVVDVRIDDIKKYEGAPGEDDVLLKDYILDKKVLDVEDREVEVVYDIKMAMCNGKLYVIEVNISEYRFLRRLGLKWLANFIYNITGKDKDEKISWKYIQPLPSTLGSFKGNVKLNILKEKLSDINPVDLADILEELDHKQRVAVFSELEVEQASDTLEEIDPNVQRDIISSIPKEYVARLIDAMTPGQAADILSVLPHVDAEKILDLLKENHKKIEAILEKQEERITNFTTSKILIYTPEKTVAFLRQQFYEIAKDKDIVDYFYIVDEHDKLVGVIDLHEVLAANPNSNLRDVMMESVISLDVESTLKEALGMFERYDFRAIPVVDKANMLIGALKFRDIADLKHNFLG